MLFNGPAILPDVYPAGLGNGQALCVDPGAVRGLFDADCPIALPRDTGMSILLTSPAYLFAIPAPAAATGMNRLVTGSALAILVITFVNLMHFSQGWVQFGYRFSLDFVAVGARPRRARDASGSGRPRFVGRRSPVVADRRLDPRQPVGRRLGQRPRMVTVPAAPRPRLRRRHRVPSRSSRPCSSACSRPRWASGG